MSRIAPIDRSAAAPAAAKTLDQIEKGLGLVPNMMATMAHSPAALNAYAAFSGAIGANGTLGGALHEQIALAVAGENTCDYCASAHTLLGGGQGLEKDELAANLRGDSADARTQAVLTFARRIVSERGFVSDADIQAVRDAGLDDGQIIEVLASVALNTFTNYFNHLADPEIDFPKVDTRATATA